ncbi:MAG: hypothetical protein WEC37_04575 [Anaerolineales bacterium]
MKNARKFASFLFIFSIALSACGSAPTAAALEQPTEAATAFATQTPTKTARPTITRAPTLTPTVAAVHLELEIVDSEIGEDSFGNLHVRVSVRNPYDFAVEEVFRPRATLLDSAGEVVRSQQLLEEGVYGPFLIQPGATHEFVGCFDPCDGGVPVGEWETYQFTFIMRKVE